MPKLIDHDSRREEIAEATWRVIHAQGISGVSIRTVAAEAGISTGSVRHVFPSKTDLLVHATELVGRRAWARIQRHLDEPDPRRLVLSVVEELLPLDAQRRAEMEVTVALVAEAPGNDRVRQVRDESYESVREVCRRLVARLHRHGLTAPALDVEAAATAQAKATASTRAARWSRRARRRAPVVQAQATAIMASPGRLSRL